MRRASTSRQHDARALGREHGGDPAADSAGGAGDDGDLIGETCCIREPVRRRTIIAPRMQRFLASDAKYAYSPDHASIGTVQPGERFEVESVEGFGNYLRVARRLHARALRRGRGAQVGRHRARSRVAGAAGRRSRGGDDPCGRGDDARRRRLRRLHRGRPVLAWWDDESACDVYPAEGGSLRFDERTTLPTRPLIGCLAVAPAEGAPAREAPGPLRRQPRLPRAPRRRDARPARRARRRRALLRRLQGADGRRRDRRAARGRRARDRERRAACAAGVDGRGRARDGREHHDARLGQAARVERPPGLPRAARLGRRGLRPRPADRLRCCSRWWRRPASARSATPTTRRTAPCRATCSSPTRQLASGRGRAPTTPITWSTTPSRTASSPSCRLTQPQAWFGMTCRWSPIAGRSRRRPSTSHVAVLLVDRVQVGAGQPDDRAVAAVGVRVGRERLRAGVDHDLARHGVRDDGDLDRRAAQRVERRAVVAVEQRVRARAQLVDARLVGEEARGRRTARDAVAAQAGAREGVARLAQQRVDLGHALADRSRRRRGSGPGSS